MNSNEDESLRTLVASIRNAIRSTAAAERDHLRRGRVERTFTPALMQAIAERVNIPDVRVDPFYNKHHDAAKRLGDRLIELDLAVHTRGTDKNNILAVELETTNTPARDDVWKVKELTKPLSGYEYRLGLFLVVGIEGRAGEVLVEEWYRGGLPYQP